MYGSMHVFALLFGTIQHFSNMLMNYHLSHDLLFDFALQLS